ncbi:MAG TPA: SRPBCC family protein [Steroidobacteraceae bacterium]|nr:SRPBCC family protein [Steroidobacteraceae bacterium]
MSDAAQSTFVYVTYIRTSPERLWDAITKPEFAKQYWFGMHLASEWKTGAPWQMKFEDGRTADQGRVLEVDPPRRLVIQWQNEFRPELKAEGPGQCTLELEPMGENVKLTVTHSSPKPNSQLIVAVSGGWPKILSNLKSLLETGKPIATEKF